MKLIYVWIKEFRNIKELGFNFSSEYKAQLIENKIQISKRPEYVSKFFGPAISDVTAIIGKNGTGKSNIIDFICTTLIKGKRNEILGSKYIYLFEENGEFFSYNKLGKSFRDIKFFSCDNLNELRVSPLIEPSKDWSCIFFSNVADGRKIKFMGNDVINLSFEENQKNQANKIKYLNYVHDKINNTNKTYITPLEKQINFKNLCFRMSFEFYLNKNEISYSLIRDRYRTAYSAKDTVNRFSYFMTASLLEYLFRYYMEDNMFSKSFERLFASIERTGTKEGFVAEKISTLKEKISVFLNECIDEHSPNFIIGITEFKSLIELLAKLQSQEYDVTKNTISYSGKYFQVQFSESLLKLLMEYSTIFNYTDMIVHDWDKLSSGMKAYLNLFSNIYSHIAHINSSSVLICIDEGDLYFHPEMQRNFLNDILQFFNQQFEGKFVQIILSSHSPFLVADLPNENLILLVNNKDNQLIIKEEYNNSLSFASNIYQLFSNQFFLENGTLGEFAKNKLNEILKLLDKDQISDDDIKLYQNVASKIGDEVIRLKVEELLLEQTFKINKWGKDFLKNWHLQKYKELEEGLHD